MPWQLYNRQLYNEHVGTKVVFIVKFFLKCVERSLENKISRERKSSEFETIRTQIQLFDVIRFHSNAIRNWHRWFSAICHVSGARDITRNRRETSLRYKQFGKGIVKYNAFKQNFTLFCSTSEHKGVSFTLWIFRWRIFDRRDVLYALGNDKVENDQPPEAANVLYWFEKVPYLLCWKLGRTLIMWYLTIGSCLVRVYL